MKKVISILLAIMVVLSLFTVSAAAADQTYLFRDFEGDTVGAASTSLPDGQETPYGATRVIENNDGNKVLRINNLTTTTLINQANGERCSSTEMFVLLDFRMDSAETDENYLCIDLHAGNTTGTRYSIYLRKGTVESGGAFSDGVWRKDYPHTTGNWYTYFIHWRNIGTSSAAASIYRKERGSSADFTLIGTSKPATGKGWNANNVVFRAYGSGTDSFLDNIVMWSGTAMAGSTFKVDTTPITAVSQITSGTLTATAKVAKSDTSAASVTPILVVNDAAGRMVDCKFLSPVTKDLKQGLNEITVSTDTSTYYDKLTGGSVGLYLWKDLVSARSMLEPAEIN